MRPVSQSQGGNLAAPDLRAQRPRCDPKNLRRLFDGEKLWRLTQHVLLRSIIRNTFRCVALREPMLGVVAVIAPEALTATGWQPVDATARYWSHPLRFGPAILDRWEVDVLCRSPYGRLEERICWACGRRV